jgi:hypothetical protein
VANQSQQTPCLYLYSGSLSNFSTFTTVAYTPTTANTLIANQVSVVSPHSQYYIPVLAVPAYIIINPAPTVPIQTDTRITQVEQQAVISVQQPQSAWPVRQ